MSRYPLRPVPRRGNREVFVFPSSSVLSDERLTSSSIGTPSPLIAPTFLRFAAWAILALGAIFRASAAEPALHVRNGWPHVAARVAAGGELRVAYLGGSITAAADGWRSLTTAHFRKLYPQLTVTEIAAGLPGTGSNLGACRVGNDVLRHQPDLLFVEFAVNDTSAPAGRIERTMEGIVRQALRANPAMDLCFVYTLSFPGLPDLEAGRFQPSARAMETVATHYGIPSLHLGVDVARLVADGKLWFKPAPPTATAPTSPVVTTVPVFSADGVHPNAGGHALYFAAIERSWPAFLGTKPTPPAPLPSPLHADNWEYATLRLFDAVARKGEWSQVPSDDANLRGVTKALLPPTWRATTPGSAIEFEFHGKEFGLLGIGAPDSGEFRVTVDQLPVVTDTFYDSYASPTFCRQREWFYPTKLEDGPHRVRVELLGTKIDKLGIKAKAGKAAEDPAPYRLDRLTLSGVLVVGSRPE